VGADVAYFIVRNLDILDRRRWEVPLLQHYLSRPAYRCWMTGGIVVWLVNRTDYHRESAITAAAACFGSDGGSRQLWRAGRVSARSRTTLP
jgi:hypothetical protein